MKKVILISKVFVVSICAILIPIALIMVFSLLGSESDTETKTIGYGYLALLSLLGTILYMTLKNILKRS